LDAPVQPAYGDFDALGDAVEAGRRTCRIAVEHQAHTGLIQPPVDFQPPSQLVWLRMWMVREQAPQAIMRRNTAKHAPSSHFIAELRIVILVRPSYRPAMF